MRSILVTGGNQGIGYALCKQLATKHNCHVYLTARNADRGNEAVSNIRKLGGSADFIQLDVSSESSIQTAASLAREKLSSSDKHQSLYGIVNNAGIGVNTAASGDVMKTNLYGTKLMCDNFIPLLDADKGRIVNIGSGGGPNYVSGICRDNKADAKMFCSPYSNEMTWEWIEQYATTHGNGNDDKEKIGLNIPSIIINSSQFAGYKKLYSATNKLAQRTKAKLHVLPETTHQNFCDTVFWLPRRWGKKLFGLGNANGYDSYCDIVTLTYKFLEDHS